VKISGIGGKQLGKRSDGMKHIKDRKRRVFLAERMKKASITHSVFGGFFGGGGGTFLVNNNNHRMPSLDLMSRIMA
jgi:hypothetical protein